MKIQIPAMTDKETEDPMASETDIATVGVMGNNYVIILGPPLAQSAMTESQAKRVRTVLCALLGNPTDEESAEAGA